MRDALVGDVEAAGFAGDEATQIVDTYLVGLRRPSHLHGRPTLHISTDAARLLGIDRRDDIPAALESWRSASRLKREGRGHNSTLDRRLKLLRQMLIDDLVAANYSEPDSNMLINEHLIGLRRPTNGVAALHASPDAVRIGEREGLIPPLTGEARPSQASSDPVAEVYLEATRRQEESGDKSAALLSYRQIVKEFRGTRQEAQARQAIERLQGFRGMGNDMIDRKPIGRL